MNAVEKIKAAITKLEAEKAASQGDHWYRSIGGISVYGGKFGANPEGLVHVRNGERSAYTPQVTSADADLIVTLHRTIEPVRIILTHSFNRATREEPGFEQSPQFRHAVALASAILGDDS